MDAFPLDASESVDTDGDGVGDNADAFPYDVSETIDTDGDGIGDNTDVFLVMRANPLILTVMGSVITGIPTMMVMVLRIQLMPSR